MNEECVITPRRTGSDPVLPPFGLLFVTPCDARQALGTVLASGGRQYHLFHSGLAVTASRDRFVAGPAVGAPMAVLCLEKLIACGARRIVQVGWAGGLQDGMAVGDVVIPVTAVSEEGTSRHYPLERQPTADSHLCRHLAGLARSLGLPVHRGRVWSTDAPYRETWAAVRRHRDQGILAVEMEFSALLAVAAFRTAALAGILLVSDLLAGKGWQPGFRDPGFQEQRQRLVSRLLHCPPPPAGPQTR